MKSKPLIQVTEKTWIFPFIASSMISLTLILAAMVNIKDTTTTTDNHGFESFPSSNRVSMKLDLGEKNLKHNENLNVGDKDTDPQEIRNLRSINDKDAFAPMPSPMEKWIGSSTTIPRLAYLISGTKGDGNRMKRVLQAIYHPNNRYILHLDLEAPPKERIDLARYVKLHPTFIEVGNVDVISKANLVTYRGPTMITCTLHAAAILLKKDKDWDWFINLSASDYPLVTQDDFLHGLSLLPKDLNFIEHSSELGWKEYQRVKPIIIDPGLYLSKKADVFLVSQRRAVPNAFKLFVGNLLSIWKTSKILPIFSLFLKMLLVKPRKIGKGDKLMI